MWTRLLKKTCVLTVNGNDCGDLVGGGWVLVVRGEVKEVIGGGEW